MSLKMRGEGGKEGKEEEEEFRFLIPLPFPPLLA